METKHKTCEERVDDGLKSRLEEIKEAVKDPDNEEKEVNILAVTRKDVYTIELSCGGPQDYFEIERDPETKEIESIS